MSAPKLRTLLTSDERSRLESYLARLNEKFSTIEAAKARHAAISTKREEVASNLAKLRGNTDPISGDFSAITTAERQLEALKSEEFKAECTIPEAETAFTDVVRYGVESHLGPILKREAETIHREVANVLRPYCMKVSESEDVYARAMHIAKNEFLLPAAAYRVCNFPSTSSAVSVEMARAWRSRIAALLAGNNPFLPAQQAT